MANTNSTHPDPEQTTITSADKLEIVPASSLQPLPCVQLVAPLQRTASGSEAFLGLASDGNQYWVKAPDNPQGSRTLIAEVIAHGIGRMLGAPVPDTALVNIPAKLPWTYKDGRQMREGVAHGSLNIPNVIESDDWGTYSRRDDNRRRQARILALWDLCMGVDPQWLHQTTADYSIWSFDHGFWLAGESDWDLVSLRQIGTSAWLYDVEPGVASASALHETADSLNDLSLESIQAIANDVPLDWNTTVVELEELTILLHARSAAVANRLRATAAQSRYP
ncbi:hypothetical protein G7066_15080 [Leucobacter coleopterorum]|uniref:HipA-like kinase domain-containing protein n=1 Tax=Leucobacter coleopterorum TaxID=2714933 RepID=A0ABX6K2S2_9MICO|nr:HipA family kinase [Leucobacter coleopterorum]QIM19567.1 hypothetical protein G7066_15080 [Leucobacter coleopterorum]